MPTARDPAGHGRAERHPRLVHRRRALRRRSTPRSRTARRDGRRGRRRHRRRRRIDPPGRRPGADRRGARAGSCRSSSALAELAGAGSRSTPATPTVARAAVAAGATHHQRRRAPRCGQVAAEHRRRVDRHAHGRRAAHHAGRPALRRRGRRGARLPRRPGRGGGRARACDEVWIDPGIGFGKTAAHNLALLGPLDRTGRHGLARSSSATSRKATHGPRCRRQRSACRRGRRRRSHDRSTDSTASMASALATATWAMARRRATMVRAHDVQAARVAAAQVVRRRDRHRRGRRVCRPRRGGLSRCRRRASGRRASRPALQLGDPGPARDLRAPGRLRREPPPRAPPGGDHLDPRAGLLAGHQPHPGPPQPPQLRRARRHVAPPALPDGRGLPEVPPRALPRDPAPARPTGQRCCVHHEELGDRIIGLVAGYLVWSGMVPEQPKAIFLVEHITSRQLGPAGREIVAVAGQAAPGTAG